MDVYIFDEYEQKEAQQFEDLIFVLSKEYTKDHELSKKIALLLYPTLYFQYSCIENIEDEKVLERIKQFIISTKR